MLSVFRAGGWNDNKGPLLGKGEKRHVMKREIGLGGILNPLVDIEDFDGPYPCSLYFSQPLPTLLPTLPLPPNSPDADQIAPTFKIMAEIIADIATNFEYVDPIVASWIQNLLDDEDESVEEVVEMTRGMLEDASLEGSTKLDELWVQRPISSVLQ